MRRAGFAVAVILGLVALAGAGIALYLAVADLRPRAETLASRAVGRPVTIAGLGIRWGNPIVVELRGLRVANAAWGSEPDFIGLDRLSAAIEPWSLIEGTPRYRHLHAEGLRVLLERGPGRIGNWKLGDGDGGSALIPKTRADFPTLFDFRLAGGMVVYRDAGSDLELQIGLDEVTIAAAGDDAPTRLVWNGSYNGSRVALEAATGTFAELRQASLPFGVSMTMVAAGGRIDFRGTLMEPLDFEGVEGAAHATISDTGRFLTALGAAADLGAPLDVTGRLRRDGPHWRLDGARGVLATSPFHGDVDLQEGPHGVADALGIDVDFAVLDLDEILKQRKTGAAEPFAAMSIEVPTTRQTHITAQLAAGKLIYRALQLSEVAADFHLLGGDIALERLAFRLAGGRVEAAASGRPVESGARWTAQADMDGLSLEALSQGLGLGVESLTGTLSGQVAVRSEGRVAREALAALDGHVVLAVDEGRIARTLIEKASTDIRALFRRNPAWTPVTCVLGLAVIENGLGRIGPLRLRTPGATFAANGTIAVAEGSVDLILRSDTRDTGFFALNIPLQLRGPLDDIDISPLAGPSKVPPSPAAPDPFPDAARALVEGNPCLR